jgi:signal transduction histidine kinase
LFWIGLIAATNYRTIPMLPRANLDVTAGAPLGVAVSVLLPLPLAVLVKLVGQTNEREFRPETSPWSIVFNRAQAGLSAGAAGYAITTIDRNSLVSLLLATVVAALVYDLVNSVASSLFVYLRGRMSFGRALRGLVAPYPSYFPLYLSLTIGLALLIVVLHERVGPASVLLLGLPLWIGYIALRSARESEDRAEELTVRVRGLETLNELGSDLLTARRRDQAERIAAAALATALDTEETVVALDGSIPEELQLVKVPGGGDAAIGVPPTTDERSMEVVEAAAGLLGMALRRLDLEDELGEVERARSNLAGKIIEEGTRERSRIGLEIHDEVLPYLAAAEIQADNVRSAIKGDDQDRADRLAAATREAVHGGISRLREVLDALTGQIVVPGGLREMLAKSLSQLRLEHGVDGRLAAPDPLPELPLAVEILVLEVVRGCLSNVAKHAGARNVLVQLHVSDTLIAVQVSDDGCGFDPVDVPKGHHGLALMQQRVELARGRFSVRSSKHGGTRVEVEVPL